MGGETGNLVAETLGRDDSNLASNLLVGLEVQSQARVVLLDENLGGLLDSLSSVGEVLKLEGIDGEGQIKGSLLIPDVCFSIAMALFFLLKYCE